MILKFNEYINESKSKEMKHMTPEEIHKIYDKYVDEFDINSIPLSIRNKCYKDIKSIYDFKNGPASEYTVDDVIEFNENKNIENKNIESVRVIIHKLVSIYGFDSNLFKAFNPYKVMIVEVKKLPVYMETTMSAIIPDIDKNIEIIEKEMNAGGYYKSYQTFFVDEQGKKWSHLIFDPIRQDSITKQIKDNCSVLFHYSDLKNDESIKQYGILAKNEGRRYVYNENRVYLFPDKLDGENIKHLNMMNNITSNRKRNNPKFDGKYMRYTILVSELPNDMEFYRDPHGDGCIFTTMDIPVDAIIKSNEVDF